LESRIKHIPNQAKIKSAFVKRDNCSQPYQNWRIPTSNLKKVVSTLANEEWNIQDFLMKDEEAPH